MSSQEQKLKEGFLTKKGGLRRNWNRRYFVLTTSTLCYYAKKATTKRNKKGSIKVKSIESVFFDLNNTILFKILTPSRLYLLRADTPSEASAWVNAIQPLAVRVRLVPSSTNPDQQVSRPHSMVEHSRSSSKLDNVTVEIANLKLNIIENKRPLPRLPANSVVDSNNHAIITPSMKSRALPYLPPDLKAGDEEESTRDNHRNQLNNSAYTASNSQPPDEDTQSEFVPFQVKALFNFKAQEEDDLNFQKGDIITVLEIDKGWWTGECKGQIGIFPENYVKRLD